MNPYRRRDTWPTFIQLSKQTTLHKRIATQSYVNDWITEYETRHMSGHTTIVASNIERKANSRTSTNDDTIGVNTIVASNSGRKDVQSNTTYVDMYGLTANDTSNTGIESIHNNTTYNDKDGLTAIVTSNTGRKAIPSKVKYYETNDLIASVTSNTSKEAMRRISKYDNVRDMGDITQEGERHGNPQLNYNCYSQKILTRTKSFCTCKHENMIPNSNIYMTLYPRYYTIPNNYSILHPPHNLRKGIVANMSPCYCTREMTRSIIISNVGLLFCHSTVNIRTVPYQPKYQLPLKNKRHQSPCIDILNKDESSKRNNENNDDICVRVRFCFLELKKSFDYNIRKVKERITPIIETAKHKVDSKIEKIKDRISPIIEKIKHKLSPFTRFLPVFLSASAIVLALSDQSTDGKSTHDICTAECRCEYVVAGSFPVCQAPSDVCGSGWINGTSVITHCFQTFSGEEACKSKHTWGVPESCKCYWEEPDFPTSDGTCRAPKGACSQLDYGGKPYYDYCLYNGSSSKQDCEDLHTLAHPNSNVFQQRHPNWCRLSLGFFIGPSIVNNMILVISLFLKLMTMWRIYTRHIDEDGDSNDLKSITTKMNVIFSFMEDLPQLTLQMFVLLQAVLFNDVGILEEVSWVVIAGLVTSLLSLSKNYTEYSLGLPNFSTSAVFTFSTAFIASGGRVLISCLMTVIYDDYNYIEDNSATWRIFLPVSIAIALQLVLFFAKICISFCRKLEGKNCLFLNQKREFSKFDEIEMTFPKPTQSSNDFSLIDIQKISNENKSIHQRLSHQAYEAVAGIRSLLFSVTSDGNSVLGLWSSICYASWALWLRMHFLGRFLYYPEIYVDVSNTALTFAMLSYTLNSILTLTNYNQRRECLIASAIFIIYPTYLYIMSKLKISSMWYDIFIHELYLDKAIDILNPIIAVASLVIIINTIVLLNCNGNSSDDSGEVHDIV